MNDDNPINMMEREMMNGNPIFDVAYAHGGRLDFVRMTAWFSQAAIDDLMARIRETSIEMHWVPATSGQVEDAKTDPTLWGVYLGWTIRVDQGE